MGFSFWSIWVIIDSFFWWFILITWDYTINIKWIWWIINMMSHFIFIPTILDNNISSLYKLEVSGNQYNPICVCQYDSSYRLYTYHKFILDILVPICFID